MDYRSLVNTAVTAAVVVVILPLLIAVSAVCASFGIEYSAGERFGMFGPMGAPHFLVLGWIVVAVAIVGTLVALLVKDPHQHA